MKLNSVHVDIVSEEKDFMALLSWRQFAYCAIAVILVYNIGKWWLSNHFSLDQVVLVIIVIGCPAILFVYLFAFFHLEEQDMYFDKFLWYYIIGKREKGIYRPKEEDDC